MASRLAAASASCETSILQPAKITARPILGPKRQALCLEEGPRVTRSRLPASASTAVTATARRDGKASYFTLLGIDTAAS